MQHSKDDGKQNANDPKKSPPKPSVKEADAESIKAIINRKPKGKGIGQKDTTSRPNPPGGITPK